MLGHARKLAWADNEKWPVAAGRSARKVDLSLARACGMRGTSCLRMPMTSNACCQDQITVT